MADYSWLQGPVSYFTDLETIGTAEWLVHGIKYLINSIISLHFQETIHFLISSYDLLSVSSLMFTFFFHESLL